MQPNVLLMTADHWPGNLLRCAGHPIIQTPTLDRLAEAGVRYSNAYTECPVCIPARRTLLTGQTARSHGDRTFQVHLSLPTAPTIATTFADAGYQTYAVGKLHVYPPRARAGFHDVLLCEEGRPQFGATDDYELYLGDQGLVGQQFLHGMSNNDYVNRPWHLEERHHVTNWTAREMARVIQRRDPTRPGFWYMSFTHPHPPLVPLESYLRVYEQLEIDTPYRGQWAVDHDQMPSLMNQRLIPMDGVDEGFIIRARRAFYALCTHIDHQLRVVLGTLREEGLLDNTILMFLSDHGDMLGNHGLWAKRLFYQDSAHIPMILVAPKDNRRVTPASVDHRLAGLQDVMPTLLDLAGIPVPASVDGESLVGQPRRNHLLGEYGEGGEATRMIHDGRYKLIYFAYQNRLQLFDLHNDPRECRDLAENEDCREVRDTLVAKLLSEAYGTDSEWHRDGKLTGVTAPPASSIDRRHLSLQRGSHWPEPR